MSFLLKEIECFGRFRKIAKSDCELRHFRLPLCPSGVRMKHLVSYWTDFYDIFYSNILRKSVE